MREIKFRGIRLDNGEWWYGSLVILNGRYFIFNDEGRYEVAPATVGQYTGLKDKNNRTCIFEGDILALPANGKEVDFEFIGWEGLYPDYVRLYVAAYNTGQCGFGLCIPSEALHDNPDICGLAGHDRMYIIGNIHDNPELLK